MTAADLRAGRALLLTREPMSGGALLAAARRLALQPLVLPVLRFGAGADHERLATRLGETADAWIALTSARAAEALTAALADGAELAPSARIAALGEGTASPLRAARLHPALVADEANAAGLAAAIASAEGPRSVLFLRGNRARRDLPDRLAASGFLVEELEVYTTEPASCDVSDLAAALDAGRLAASVVWSPAAAEALLGRLGPRHGAAWLGAPVLVPGRTTAAALEALGARRVVVAGRPTEQGLAKALSSIAADRGAAPPAAPEGGIE
jgi:uroporphyrinogen-III synthase